MKLTREQWTRLAVPELERLAPIGDGVLAFGLGQAQPRGLWLEFGVAGGGSLTRIADAAKRPPGEEAPYVAGFDSFEGLPEDWVWNPTQHVPKGTFRQEAPPIVAGAEIVVGLFNQTLAPWFEARRAKASEAVTFAHVDCDLYASARTVLTTLAPHLARGAIVVFDELVGYVGFDAHEWRALFEVAIEEERFRFEWLARHGHGQQVAIRVV